VQSAKAGRYDISTTMYRLIAPLLLFIVFALPAQQPPGRPDKEPEETRLPNGKMQKEEILKADHEKTLADSAALLKAAEDLKMELEKTDRHVLSVNTLKQLDNIEKLSKRIRSRLKKY
jgi:hypothetical protein